MEIHALNVSAGSCAILRHDNGGVSVVDFCDRRDPHLVPFVECPIDYLSQMGVRRVTRFILSRADMNHMRGLAELRDRFGFYNFWHSNVLPAQLVDATSGYDQRDFECYMNLLLGRVPGCKEITVSSGYKSGLCNIEVISPTMGMIHQPDLTEGEKSLVLLVTTAGGHRVLLVGDVGLNAWRSMLAEESLRLKLSDVDVVLSTQQGVDFTAVFQSFPMLMPQIVIGDGVGGTAYAFGAECFSLGLTGTVLLEDVGPELDVYVANRLADSRWSSAMPLQKHPHYDAWLVKRVFHRQRNER